MEVRDGDAELAPRAPAVRGPRRRSPLGMPERAAATARPLFGMLRGGIFPRVESLRGLSQPQGFAEELRGIFFSEKLLFVREVCKKRPAETMQPHGCWWFHWAGCSLWGEVPAAGAVNAPQQLVLAAAGGPGRGAAAPVLELSKDRGLNV